MAAGKHCLDLFAGLGGFSAAFREADGWTVTTVDIDDEFSPDICADVMELRPGDLPSADVVLAGVDCRYFSTAGNHDQWDHGAREPIGDGAREAVALAHHTVGLIQALAPDVWVIENPVGRMRWVLGEPSATVTQCQYGTPYRKATDLFGDLPDGFTPRWCPTGADCHVYNTDGNGRSDVVSVMGRDRSERSKIPHELSRALYEAVEGRSEQTTLTEVA